ncbi:hypothetical protein LRHK_1893 [Lacticaseibacillus rhamnosus ATCC 8530]|nr:hypothetical protein LRHK_1893 [Lacticaseibacillus rhamnosus ATCC 8530]
MSITPTQKLSLVGSFQQFQTNMRQAEMLQNDFKSRKS